MEILPSVRSAQFSSPGVTFYPELEYPKKGRIAFFREGGGSWMAPPIRGIVLPKDCLRSLCMALVLALLFIQSVAIANDDVVPGSRYESGRAAAMGDAFIPVSGDIASGLFYNPANLATVHHAVFEPMNFSVMANSHFFQAPGGNVFTSGSTSQLDKVAGSYVGMGGQFVPTIGLPWASFGLLISSETAGESNGNGTYNYRSLYQLIPTIGNGWAFHHGMFRIGYSVQWVNEAVGSGTSTSGGNVNYNQNLQQGSGLSGNVGLGIIVPLRLVPSFNFVFRNIGSLHYWNQTLLSMSSASAGTPANQPMTADVSFSLHPRLGGGGRLNFVIEERDVSNRSQLPFLTRSAVGLEWSLSGEFYLRGGARGGGPSGGIGIRRRGAELSISYYTANIPTVGFDSRWMLQYQIRSF